MSFADRNIIGQLYICHKKDIIPNASAVHTVIKNKNGEWQFSGGILCLFKEPIMILDCWTKTVTVRQKKYFYIALYQDKNIALPIKWIDDKEPIYKRINNE